MIGRGGAWDSTSAFRPDKSFPTRPELVGHSEIEKSTAAINGSTSIPPTSHALGNFDKIWEFLGASPTTLQPVNGFIKSEISTTDENGSSESESPTIVAGTVKAVKWRDHIEGADLADIDELKPNDFDHLNKSQRKKARRRIRKHAEIEQGKPSKETPRCGNLSDQESEKEIVSVEQSAFKRRNLINEILNGTPKKVENAIPSLSTPTKTAVTHDPDPRTTAYLQTPPSIIRRPVSAPLPNAFAETASKKALLLGKLTTKFEEELQYLSGISLVHPPQDEDANLTNGIHIFVDASNIMIGFHEALKSSRKIYNLRRQPFSFHNLSLILERGRPIAKRVLAGSDNFPAIAEAQVIGYECNILDRVHKAKELTPRQKRYLDRSSNGTTNGNATTSGSGSETNTAAATQYAPEKWVEQAVDEILHLKILESVVDANVPATMVLATGDAAEAEYSQGFLKMVTRALEKGWRVEVVSFRQNISGMYKRREFRAKWGTKFKIIELDDYVEELLGVQV